MAEYLMGFSGEEVLDDETIDSILDILEGVMLRRLREAIPPSGVEYPDWGVLDMSLLEEG